MVSIVRQQVRAAWPVTRGSGFNMAEGHRGQPADFTVTVLPRNDQQRESDSESGPTPGGETLTDGQDAYAEQRNNEEETDCENTLSVEEEMRIQQKRERNRLAAARCRDRRRQRAATLVQESDDLEDENEDLMKEIAELQKEKLNLQEILCEHLPNCGVQFGESNQQQIPHRVHGKHPGLEHHPQHQHVQPRQCQRQHRHPLLLNQHPLLLNQQHRQQIPRQQRPQHPTQEHHPPEQKPDSRQDHRPKQQQEVRQQFQQHQLQHQQCDQQTTTTNQLVSQQPFCLATQSFSATK